MRTDIVLTIKSSSSMTNFLSNNSGLHPSKNNVKLTYMPHRAGQTISYLKYYYESAGSRP